MKNLRVLLIIFASIFLLVSISAIVAYSNYNNLKHSNSLLVHANEELYKSENLLSVLKDIETGTREFVITGDSNFLEPYFQSRSKIPASIAELRVLIKNNTLEKKLIDTLALLANEKLAMSQTIQNERNNYSNNLQGLKPLLITGKSIMDSVRAIIRRLQQKQNGQLQDQQKINEANSKQVEVNTFVLFGTMLIALAIIGLAAQYFSRLRKTERNALLQLNSKLTFVSKRVDDIIKGISDPFFALDNNYNFIFLNDAVQKTLGKTSGNLLGKNFFEKFPRYEETVMGKKIRGVMKARKSEAFEDYEIFLEQWQDVTIYPTSEGISVSIKDATKRKANEKELNTTKKLLEETNKVALVGGWELDVVAGNVVWTEVTRLIHETGPGYVPDLKNGIHFYKEGKSRDTIIQCVNDAIENGKNWDEELQIITAKGNERWIRTQGITEFENGECKRLLGTFQDIDEKKKMADLLNRKEQLFTSAFDNSTQGMALLTPGRQIIQVNESLCKITGYTKEELLNKNLDAITYPGDVATDKKVYNELLNATKAAWQYEKRYIHKDGHIIWIIASVSAITGADGSVINFVAQMQDITESKVAGQKLTNEKKLLKTIIDALPLNIYMKDLHSRKTVINKSELHFTGGTKEEDILGKSDFDLYPHEYALISVKEDNEVFSTRKSILNMETKSVNKDGVAIWFLTSKIPFINDFGEVTGLIGISYDITQRKLSEGKT